MKILANGTGMITHSRTFSQIYYASQNTNLSPNKLTWHDQNTIDDFSAKNNSTLMRFRGIGIYCLIPVLLLSPELRISKN